MFQILVSFLCNNCTPPLPQKSHPLSPSNPSLKIEILTRPHWAQSPHPERGVHTMLSKMREFKTLFSTKQTVYTLR